MKLVAIKLNHEVHIIPLATYSNIVWDVSRSSIMLGQLLSRHALTWSVIFSTF